MNLNKLTTQPTHTPGDTRPAVQPKKIGPAPTDPKLFTDNPTLTQLSHTAQSCGLPPAGLLGAVLARATAEADKQWYLPPIIGNESSPLSLYICLAGEPGAGKSQCISTARNLMTQQQLTAINITDKMPSSGPGFVSMFGEMEAQYDTNGKKTGKSRFVQTEHTALLEADELDNLLAIKGRENLRLGPVLRTAWSGANLGDWGTTEDRRRHLKRPYRVSIVAGGQPTLAGQMLTPDSKRIGDAARWIFLPLQDP